MVPTRGWLSAGPRQALPRCMATSGYTDTRVRSMMQDRNRSPLPFRFSRGDIPYVPPHTRMTEMPTLTSAFTTRMTTREQARMDLEETSMPRLTEEQLPTWMEYHQRHAQQLAEGRRAIERIARNAVDASNEPDIHPDPHPLLDGGRTMVDRLGPDSSIFRIGRPRYRAGADEFDNMMCSLNDNSVLRKFSEA